MKCSIASEKKYLEKKEKKLTENNTLTYFLRVEKNVMRELKCEERIEKKGKKDGVKNIDWK